MTESPPPAPPGQTQVTALITAYNAAPYVEQAVRSLLSQELPAGWGADALEVIAVDDGSDDGTGEILDRVAAGDPRLRVLHPGRVRRVAALNLGLAEARGKYLAILDADDVALPGRLRRQVEYLDAHPDVAVVGGAAEFVTAAGAPVGRVQRNPVDESAIRTQLRNDAAFTHSTVMMRVEAARAVGGYRRPFPPSEDYDLWVRLAERHKLANLPDVLVQYRLHPSQLSNRQARRQLLTQLAIRASAKARERGDPDPAEGAGEWDDALLAALGLAGEATERQLDEMVAVRASLLVRDGCEADARAILDELLAARGPVRGRRALRALRDFALGRGELLRGRRVRGTALLARAVLRRPASLVEMAAKAGRWLARP